MWIIPKNSSMYRSAQDMGALISDSQELSELCAQSLLWRSKPSQPSTWSKRLKPGTLMNALSTQTLTPSLGGSIVGEWISCQEAFLASHLVESDPEGEHQTATLDTCGPTLPTELNTWGTLPLFSWKTSRGSSAASSQAQSGQTQRARPFSCMSSESWRGWVTRRRQEYSARARSVRPISESGCLSWVVAPISARQGEESSISCSEGQSEDKSKIKNQVQITHGLPQEGQNNTHGNLEGSLNPRWVEVIMGLPVGWAMPSCANPWTAAQTSCECSAMESCQRQQSEHFEYCGSYWPTPPASQRGDTVETYERRSQKRESKGGARFAPTLQVAVLMEIQRERDE